MLQELWNSIKIMLWVKLLIKI